MFRCRLRSPVVLALLIVVLVTAGVPSSATAGAPGPSPRVIWQPQTTIVTAFVGETFTVEVPFVVADRRGRPRPEELVVIAQARHLVVTPAPAVLGPIELWEQRIVAIDVEAPADVPAGWYLVDLRLQDTAFTRPLPGYARVWVHLRGDVDRQDEFALPRVRSPFRPIRSPQPRPVEATP